MCNQYNRLLRQHQGSKALSASKGTARRIVERRVGDPAINSRVTASTAERRVAALKYTGAQRKKSINQEMPPPTKRVEVGASATSVGVRSISRINIVACVDVLRTRLTILRSEELKMVRRWQK